MVQQLLRMVQLRMVLMLMVLILMVSVLVLAAYSVPLPFSHLPSLF
jgi:hypothetical protein